MVREVDPVLLACRGGPEGGEERALELRFLSSDGCTLVGESAEGLEPGAALSLSFSSPLLATPFRLAAAVREVREGEADLRFEDWGERRAALPGELRRLFNVRRIQRIHPRHRERIEVELKAPKHPLPLRGTMRDLSYLGMGIHLPGRQVRHLSVGMVVKVRFHLMALRETIETDLKLAHVGDRDGPHGPITGGRFRFERGEALKMRRKLNAFSVRRMREEQEEG